MQESLDIIEKGPDCNFNQSPKEFSALIIVEKTKTSKLIGQFFPELTGWQKKQTESSDCILSWDTPSGPARIIRLWCVKKPKGAVHTKEDYPAARDLCGQALRSFPKASADTVAVILDDLESDQVLGVLCGVQIAAYKYKRVLKGAFVTQKIVFKKQEGTISDEEIKKSQAIAASVNTARHLVNLPPNQLHPKSFSKLLESCFKADKEFTVDVWDKNRLKEEKMNLLLAVGKGADESPRLVHIQYRGAASSVQPIAFVGKGITFDTGGLNLKPASPMRLMKKDMGGSACLAGLALWSKIYKPKNNFDFYFALAENSVDSDAFRPSDVIQSRSGQTVEIDNTDAEGRLVLADALDVACDNKPQMIIDVATLTGATRVALGFDIGGLFCDDKKITQDLEKASQGMGDLLWSLPLYQPYFKPLKSNFADLANSAPLFQSGGIRAALFLQKFIKNEIPWAHIDFHSWTSKAEGALSESGGSGQLVQCLIGFLGGGTK